MSSVSGRVTFMNYSEMTLSEFVYRLGSRDAVPGGGGASALAGCLGAALGKMVAHLTLNRKQYENVWGEMEDVIREEEKLQEELLDLISEDARMFEPLSKAYSMPRKTPQEMEKRQQVMEEALKDACQVPLQIMEKVCRAIDLAKITAEKGSTLAVSDAGDAAALCAAALKSASLNVYVNTNLMKNRALAEEYNERADRMITEYVPLAEQIYSEVLKKLMPGSGIWRKC